MAEHQLPEEASEPSKQTPPQKRSGDTSVAPSNTPSSNERAAAEPVRKALHDALSEVNSPAKADDTVRQLEEMALGQKTTEIEKPTPTDNLDSAAAHVESTSQSTPASEKAAAVIVETARAIANTSGRESEAVAQAAQDVLNPEQHGTPDPGETEQLEYLRAALLKRLKPIDAFDALLFLKINHLPHNRFLNRFFYFITRIFTGGLVWVVLLQISQLYKRLPEKHVGSETGLPLILATIMVEVPLKRFFKRRRPFIKDVQAVAVGIKPNSWSFPSGHASAAFAGAWLLARYFPKQRGLLYAFATLGAFSRVYLGDHYPGDVVSGSLLGVVFAKVFLVLIKFWRRK